MTEAEIKLGSTYRGGKRMSLRRVETVYGLHNPREYLFYRNLETKRISFMITANFAKWAVWEVIGDTTEANS